MPPQSRKRIPSVSVLCLFLWSVPLPGTAAAFTDANWVSLNAPPPGVNGNVWAIATDRNGQLYVGGSFAQMGTAAVRNIARWDGSAWSALGAGVEGNVWALAVMGTDLYVGGDFASAGGRPLANIARWDGTAWSEVGSGTDATVAALAVAGTNLYVGGGFWKAGGLQVNKIAKWNGQAWSALGTGIADEYGSVSALATSGTTLYAGGAFSQAGAVPANNLARWNGSNWSAVGVGSAWAVEALAVLGGSLYVAGNPWIDAYIARWNGSSWSALGTGTSGGVTALAVDGTNLYVCGMFTLAGNRAASHIARWDGSQWSALGSGVNGSADALAVDGAGHLFIGGAFTTAGTNASPWIAQANIGAAPGRFSACSLSTATGFTASFQDGTVGEPYRIQASSSLVSPAWTDLTNFTYLEAVVFTDESARGTTQRFYRAVSP